MRFVPRLLILTFALGAWGLGTALAQSSSDTGSIGAPKPIKTIKVAPADGVMPGAPHPRGAPLDAQAGEDASQVGSTARVQELRVRPNVLWDPGPAPSSVPDNRR